MLQKAEILYKNAINVFMIDITSPDGEKIAKLYNIQSTPTIVINGIIKFRGVPPSPNHLYEEIERYLPSDMVKRAIKKQEMRQRDRDMMFG